MVLDTITKNLFSSDSKYPKEFQKIITHFTSDYNLKDKEESAFSRTEYENAANFKSERLRNEQDYQKRKDEWQKEHEVSETVRDHDIAALIEERTGVPVTRLLEGDVGSGKTIVSVLAAAIVISHDAQVAVMAPTEILAEQHYKSFMEFCKPIGLYSISKNNGHCYN